MNDNQCKNCGRPVEPKVQYCEDCFAAAEKHFKSEATEILEAITAPEVNKEAYKLWTQCKKEIAMKHGLGKLVTGHAVKYFDEAAALYRETIQQPSKP